MAHARVAFRRIFKPQRPLIKLRFYLSIAFSNRCYTALDTPLVHEEPKKAYSYAERVTEGKKPKKHKAVKLERPKGARRKDSAKAASARLVRKRADRNQRDQE